MSRARSCCIIDGDRHGSIRFVHRSHRPSLQQGAVLEYKIPQITAEIAISVIGKISLRLMYLVGLRQNGVSPQAICSSTVLLGMALS